MDKLDPNIEWCRIDEAGGMGIHFLEEGQLKLVFVKGNGLCIARRNSQLFALRNRCPHAGGPLNQGFLDEAGNVVCPWHRYRFCLEDGKYVEGAGSAAETFPIEINVEGTFVGLPRRKKWLGLF